MIQTLKSILARPAHSAALFIEIVIVSVIGWIAIEPVAVDTTTALIPPGYDVDRLVRLSITQFNKEAEEFDSALYTSDGIREAKEQLLRMVRDRKETAYATFTSWASMEQESSTQSNIMADSLFNKHNDTEEKNKILIYKVAFVPGTDFFKTFGIKSPEGKPFAEPDMPSDAWIVTNTLAKAVSPQGKVIGKDLFPYDEKDEEDSHSPISAVTGDITYSKRKGRTALAFKPIEMNTENNGWYDAITVRIADGVNPDSFIDRLNDELNDLRCGNLYLSEPTLYSDLREELFSDKKRDLTRKWIILGFFLINVFLGVAGTFYIQCRTRIPDAGVMRAFGATKSNVVRSIVGEACLTAFIAWAVGSILYLIYLHHQGFPMETDANHVIQAIRPLWHDTKFGRYSVIGSIVLAILLLTAALGAWLPARRVGRVPIIDSLRDE